MIIINSILVGIFSVLLIISPFLKKNPSILYNIRFLSCLFTVSCGYRIIEEIFKISWFKSLIIIVIYLMTITIITKIIESIHNKSK
jgi:hypothetical protein